MTFLAAVEERQLMILVKTPTTYAHILYEHCVDRLYVENSSKDINHIFKGIVPGGIS